MKKIIFGIALLAVVAFFAFKLLANKKEIDAAATFIEKISNVPVNTAEVKLQKVGDGYEYLGTFQPYKEVNFGAESQGKIIAVSVQEGDRISQGQVIAKIDDEMLKIKLSAEEASLEKIKRDLQRYENLSKEEAVSDINLQQARLGVKTTESQVASTQKSISLTTIKAPISGTLTQKNFEVGSVVAPGTPLGILTDISSLKFTVMIPEADIIKFKEGQEVKVAVDIYPQTTYAGRISLIAVKSDANHNYKIEVLVANNNAQFPIRAGMYGRILSKEAGASERLVIPRSALVGSVKQPQVYVIVSGKAILKNIEIGNSFGDLLEVKTGLEAGEKVITSGQINLEDGMTVVSK